MAPRLLPIRRGFVVVAGDGVSTRAPIMAGFSTVTRGERRDEGGEGFAAEVLGRGGFLFGKPHRVSVRGSGYGEGESGEARADRMRGTVKENGAHDREANAGYGLVSARSKRSTGLED